MFTKLASESEGDESSDAEEEDQQPFGDDWQDDEAQPIWMYVDGAVPRQVQRKMNDKINNAVGKEETTVPTYRETHRGRRRFDVDVQNKTMSAFSGGNQISLSVCQLNDARDRAGASEPIWQFAENWGWESFSAEHQATLEAAFQQVETTGVSELELSHVWTKKPTSRPERQVTDRYTIDLQRFTQTAMQDKHTVRRIRRVERVPAAQASVGGAIAAGGTDNAVPAADTETRATSAVNTMPDQSTGTKTDAASAVDADQQQCGNGSQPAQSQHAASAVDADQQQCGNGSQPAQSQQQQCGNGSQPQQGSSQPEPEPRKWAREWKKIFERFQ